MPGSHIFTAGEAAAVSKWPLKLLLWLFSLVINTLCAMLCWTLCSRVTQPFAGSWFAVFCLVHEPSPCKCESIRISYVPIGAVCSESGSDTDDGVGGGDVGRSNPKENHSLCLLTNLSLWEPTALLFHLALTWVTKEVTLLHLSDSEAWGNLSSIKALQNGLKSLEDGNTLALNAASIRSNRVTIFSSSQTLSILTFHNQNIWMWESGMINDCAWRCSVSYCSISYLDKMVFLRFYAKKSGFPGGKFWHAALIDF